MRENAKDFFFDFLNTVFTILFSVFCFFYFVLGNRMGLAEDIARMVGVLSLFGLLYLVEIKQARKKAFSQAERHSLDDVLVYFSETDKLKDGIAMLALPVLSFGIGYFSRKTGAFDAAQSILVLVLAYPWHAYLFRRREDANLLMFATYYDRIKDGIFSFFLPAAMFGFAIWSGSVGATDQLQALSIFAAYYFWHKILFRRK